MMNHVWKVLTRRKGNDENENESKLDRVLTLFDLTALGVGSTLGLGVYVLAGSVAYQDAGPAVTISFLIAAIASGFAAMCYAEFAARVPKAGSAYVYTYVSVGEFLAFTIGWNLILEYIIGTSSVARGLSIYLDEMTGNKMQTFFRSQFPIDISFLADYPDPFSFVMIMLLAGLLAVGVRESSLLNNVFTVINLATVVIVIVTGTMKADVSNWFIPKENIPAGVHGGEGGFMPFGVAGVMAGAAKCFYGFVGFDCVATTGEEAINPTRNIPMSIMLSLIIILLSYFGVSTVLTMMLPYYLQDPNSPFPHVYNMIGWVEVKWIVSIGAVFALCTSLLGAMFPLPRILYAMSSDGIIFATLKRIHPKTKTPLLATMLSGLIAAVMAMMFNLQQLIDMMSIGTLLAYTIVAICVLVLRFRCDAVTSSKPHSVTYGNVLRQLFNIDGETTPSRLSSTVCDVAVVLFCLCTIPVCILLDTFYGGASTTQIVWLTVSVCVLVIIVSIVARQPRNSMKLNFNVPFVPTLPFVSIFMNLYLMFQLDFHTWIRFGVWIIIGYIIYFGYGIRHSVERTQTNRACDDEQTKNTPAAFNGRSMNSVDDLRHANMDFVTVSTIALNEKFQ